MLKQNNKRTSYLSQPLIVDSQEMIVRNPSLARQFFWLGFIPSLIFTVGWINLQCFGFWAISKKIQRLHQRAARNVVKRAAWNKENIRYRRRAENNLVYLSWSEQQKVPKAQIKQTRGERIKTFEIVGCACEEQYGQILTNREYQQKERIAKKTMVRVRRELQKSWPPGICRPQVGNGWNLKLNVDVEIKYIQQGLPLRRVDDGSLYYYVLFCQNFATLTALQTGKKYFKNPQDCPFDARTSVKLYLGSCTTRCGTSSDSSSNFTCC